MCFGANTADQRNKNAFKFVLQLLILSQKQILCVKNVVWGGFGLVWRWFGGVSTDPSQTRETVYCVSKSYVLKYCPKFKANIQFT